MASIANKLKHGDGKLFRSQLWVGHIEEQIFLKQGT